MLYTNTKYVYCLEMLIWSVLSYGISENAEIYENLQ